MKAVIILVAWLVTGFGLQAYEMCLEIRFARECEGRDISLWEAATVQSNRHHKGLYPIIGPKTCATEG